MSWIFLPWLTSSPAGAPPRAVELLWSAPASCPQKDWAESQLEREAHPEQAGGNLEARVHITPSARGFRLLVETKQAERRGRRQLEAESCQEAAEAAVVLLAMAVHGQLDEPAPARKEERPARAANEEPRAPEPRAPRASSTNPTPHEEASDSDARAGFPGFVRLGGALDSGGLPRAAFGLLGHVGYRFAPVTRAFDFTLELRLGAFLPVTIPVTNEDAVPLPGEVAGRFTLVDVLAAGCFEDARSLSSWVLSGCFGAGVATLFAEGRGVPDASQTFSPSPSFSVEAGLGYLLTPWLVLRLAGAVHFRVLRENYAIEGIGPLFLPPPLSFRPTLTAEMRF